MLSPLGPSSCVCMKQEKIRIRKKPKKKMTYRIQAVVEGRAWIQSSAGSNMTVKVGDEVKDYGTITKIDAINSVVETSSGRVIKVN